MGHQNNDKKFELEMELFLNLGPPEILNLGPPERQCVTQCLRKNNTWPHILLDNLDVKISV